jgi:hypothetical protein
VTAILVAVLLFILVGFAALAVDVGYYMVTRNDLQNIADASALYGARILGNNYEGMTPAAQQAYVCDPAEIVPGVQEVGLANYAGDLDGIAIDAGDVRIGQWDSSATPRFTPTLNRPDAVSVTVRREGGTNGPISSIFARILGINTFDVSADATAALTGQGTSGEGDLELPVGISAFFFDGYGCNDWIKFSPTNDPDSCAGWTSWEYRANDRMLRNILEGALDEANGGTNDYPSPDMVAGGDTAEFIGGDLSNNTFDAMMDLYRARGCDYDPGPTDALDDDSYILLGADGECVPGHLGDDEGVPLLDDEGVRLEYPDGTPRNYHKWETLVIVYDWDDCSNPNTEIVIAGYATIALVDVLGPPDKLLRGRIMCELFSNDPERGGGGNYGTMGTIPGLVE